MALPNRKTDKDEREYDGIFRGREKSKEIMEKDEELRGLYDYEAKQ